MARPVCRNILNYQKPIISAMNWGPGSLPSDEEIAHVKFLGKFYAECQIVDIISFLV